VTAGRFLVPEAKVWLDGQLVTVVSLLSSDEAGIWCIVELPDGTLQRKHFMPEEVAAALVPANDGGGDPQRTLSALWGKWMNWSIPRIRSAVLATRPLHPYAHQDEAVFGVMLKQPRLRFLLADEPGTGKTIMTGMYLAEGRRRGLVPGRTIIIVPAHLVPKWTRDLRRLFGIEVKRITAEIGRELEELRPDVDVWVVSIDLFTYNADVRRKVVGREASWSLAVFDEVHRLTPTSQYLDTARQVASAAHHLLLLTATPHRGNEHFFRALLNLLEPALYPWSAGTTDYGGSRLRPSELHFLRRMKEDLRGFDHEPLFPARYAEVQGVQLAGIEQGTYDAVMEYVDEWYKDRATLARSIYGKRAASSLKAAYETLRRRQEVLSSAQVGKAEPIAPRGFDAEALAGAPLDDDEAWEEAEQAVVQAKSRDRRAELRAVGLVLDQLGAALASSQPAAKWVRMTELLAAHGIRPGSGQCLVFTEFLDTAAWLAELLAAANYSTEVLAGDTSAERRDALQRRFLAGKFQVLVSTDAGGEGIDLQSAHVMIDWDIPWSLVRLEQRMGRLHRIGQTRDVYIYHLVAFGTREGRVQERVLENLKAASEALNGRVYDLLDATTARAGMSFARLLTEAQASKTAAEAAAAEVPSPKALLAQARELAGEEDRLRNPADPEAARQRFADDQLEAINPVMVEGFVRQLAAAEGWEVGYGAAAGLLLLRAARGLPGELGGGRTALVSADGETVQRAHASGADVSDVVMLGPSEPAFSALVARAAAHESELRRGAALEDPGSLSDYLLFAYTSGVDLHDGARTEHRALPLLMRVSADEAFPVGWESILRLRPGTPPVALPTPAGRQLAADAARVTVAREREKLCAERTSWVATARADLDDVEARYQRQIRAYPAAQRAELRSAFAAEKARRLAQLDRIAQITTTPPRLLGWALVHGTAVPVELGTDPDSERVAVEAVWSELESRGFEVDDRSTASVGYDLLARHRLTGEHRLVEVKGQVGGLGPVILEQHEWAQARQRGAAYWLYVVTACATAPTITIRVADPANVFAGPSVIQRFQIPVSELRRVTTNERRT
jgi:superfamily II DNA or RNA helicase